MLEIVSFTLGPAQTNSYLAADPETKEAVVIDPSWDGHIILKAARVRDWRIGHLWYTHAHFDHIGGAAAIADALNPLPLVALHPDDHVLWRAGGGGALFGYDIDPGPEPTTAHALCSCASASFGRPVAASFFSSSRRPITRKESFWAVV